MSRGVQSFKQGNVTKLVRGAAKGGMKVARVEVVDGKIIVIGTLGAPGEAAVEPHNEWDNVK